MKDMPEHALVHSCNLLLTYTCSPSRDLWGISACGIFCHLQNPMYYTCKLLKLSSFLPFSWFYQSPHASQWKDPALSKVNHFCRESRCMDQWVPIINLPERWTASLPGSAKRPFSWFCYLHRKSAVNADGPVVTIGSNPKELLDGIMKRQHQTEWIWRNNDEAPAILKGCVE